MWECCELNILYHGSKGPDREDGICEEKEQGLFRVGMKSPQKNKANKYFLLWQSLERQSLEHISDGRISCRSRELAVYHPKVQGYINKDCYKKVGCVRKTS